MTKDEKIWRELEELKNDYRQRFPNAQELEGFSFSPANLIAILREANGREVEFSYPLQGQGVLDGCAYSFKETAASEAAHPITLQELLYSRAPTLKQCRVKIVRHRDTSGKRDLLKEYRDDEATFLDYQRQQVKPVFHQCDYVVSFLGEEGSRARFIGVYQVQGFEHTNGYFYYTLMDVPGFEALKERVVTKWNGAPINWQQWLNPALPVTVVEIQNKPFGRPFTGYLDFTLTFAQLKQLVKDQEPHDEWRRMLSAVSGIYLILDTSTGDHYIGSAYGKEGGVWNRWEQYVRTKGPGGHVGHGGNVALQELTDLDPTHARHFQFTLLMTLNRTTASEEVMVWENIFKKKINPKLCRN